MCIIVDVDIIYPNMTTSITDMRVIYLVSRFLPRSVLAPPVSLQHRALHPAPPLRQSQAGAARRGFGSACGRACRGRGARGSGGTCGSCGMIGMMPREESTFVSHYESLILFFHGLVPLSIKIQPLFNIVYIYTLI